MTQPSKRLRSTWRVAASLIVAGLETAGPVQGQSGPDNACSYLPPKLPPAICPAGKRCYAIPLGAIPAPNGYYLRRWETVQTSLAAEDRFVIYKHEWYQGGVHLGPYGRYHLNEIIKHLPGVPFPVLLQADLHEELNQVRRQIIIQALLECGIPDAAERVIVGFPRAEGLYGEEAPRLFNRMLLGTGRGGQGGGLGGGAPFGGVGGSLGGTGRVGVDPIR